MDDLYTVYQALTADPSKLFELLTTEPEDELNSSEQHVYLYLQQFVGNMRSDELQNFLRFVTSCSVCSNIKVIFNSLSGLAPSVTLVTIHLSCPVYTLFTCV